MTKQVKELLKQLDGAYRLDRLDKMGRLQNKLVKEITKSRIMPQDVLMVLTVITRQVEGIFISNLQPKQEKDNGSNVEEAGL
ncbi:unnamed protein product [marine sediment metagenome]|uniref:Uncharacterized protein n=1 Tax=marine sediment metagenome TaxID=412755 RepID=X1DCC9_9ZZZZ